MTPTYLQNIWAALTNFVAARGAVIHAAFTVIGGAVVGQLISEVNSPSGQINWPAVEHAALVAGLAWVGAYFKSPTLPSPPKYNQTKGVPGNSHSTHRCGHRSAGYPLRR